MMNYYNKFKINHNEIFDIITHNNEDKNSYNNNDSLEIYSVEKKEKDIKENKVDDEDAVLEEALKEVKERRKDIKKLTSAIKESTEVLDATNNNMDNPIYNVNQAEKKLK